MTVTSDLKSLQKELARLASPSQAANLSRFFKTGPGQYGEGDRFLGLTMPQQREIAKKYRHLPLRDLDTLLGSPFHEHRMTALLILMLQYQKADEHGKRELYTFYLDHRAGINNWDLVDVTCPRVVGHYLLHHPEERSILTTYARSADLWERRMAVLATFAFLADRDFADSFRIADILLHDPHDLIHKAVGWMLREIGKRDLKAEEDFLKSRYQTMPRTMLRYAIERFEETKRQKYLHGSILPL